LYRESSAMASIVVLKNLRERENHSTDAAVPAAHIAKNEIQPSYLQKFPSADSILHDLKLRVLLGRFLILIEYSTM
jgi:hypothetical protein